jgi:hypothetical protein
MQPAKALKDKMYLGSPAVTNGANGMGLDWLREFMKQCDGCNIDFICIHWYASHLPVPSPSPSSLLSLMRLLLFSSEEQPH